MFWNLHRDPSSSSFSLAPHEFFSFASLPRNLFQPTGSLLCSRDSSSPKPIDSFRPSSSPVAHRGFCATQPDQWSVIFPFS
ncbi:hypothetical protein MUK42_21488 [Musa troglodytarum]|uniref:Uncharacterized protein n=1 Tax=Musa troglodytarum TaxID=320322 RepID=A0A9E7FRA5_9LILI|nr:hypothetical protein MUK42_21488 [Musa troglodytarum]